MIKYRGEIHSFAMKTFIELDLKPTLSQPALDKLVALSVTKRRPVEALIVAAIERYVQQESPEETQLMMAGSGGGR